MELDADCRDINKRNRENGGDIEMVVSSVRFSESCL